jgi:rhodanese-related sulfurtransferase
MNLFKMFKGLFTSAPRIEPLECAARIRSGQAYLIDVREADERAQAVAEGAMLLPLSDLAGPRTQWQPFLATVAQKELFLYCGAGVRSGMAARVLTNEGFRAANAGSFVDWEASGWPVVRPKATGSRR